MAPLKKERDFGIVQRRPFMRRKKFYKGGRAGRSVKWVPASGRLGGGRESRKGDWRKHAVGGKGSWGE